MHIAIMTEKEFVEALEISFADLAIWLNMELLEPLQTGESFNIYFPKDFRLAKKIKLLVEQNIQLGRIKESIVDYDIDLNDFAITLNPEERFAELNAMTIEELQEIAAIENITGRRRMPKEMLIKAILEPEYRTEALSIVRGRSTETDNTEEPIENTNVEEEHIGNTEETPNETIEETLQVQTNNNLDRIVTVGNRDYTVQQIQSMKGKELINLAKSVQGFRYFNRLKVGELKDAFINNRIEHYIQIGFSRQQGYSNLVAQEPQVQNMETAIFPEMNNVSSVENLISTGEVLTPTTESNTLIGQGGSTTRVIRRNSPSEHSNSEERNSETINRQTIEENENVATPRTRPLQRNLEEIVITDETETLPDFPSIIVGTNNSATYGGITYTREDLKRLKLRSGNPTLIDLIKQVENIKYYRRMAEEEIIEVLLDHQRKYEMMQRAKIRYDFYNRK